MCKSLPRQTKLESGIKASIRLLTLILNKPCSLGSVASKEEVEGADIESKSKLIIIFSKVM